MNLSKIKQKIEARAYQSVSEFVYDFALVPFNAQMFNSSGSGAYHDALIIERELKQQLQRLVDTGVIDGEDSTLPDLAEAPSHGYTPDRSYHLDGSRSEGLLALDASMRSLREWQEKHGGAQLRSSSKMDLPKDSQTPPTDSSPEPMAKICYTCRHRFTQPVDADGCDCPKCGSDFIFADVPWNTYPDVQVPNTAQKHELEPTQHPLGIAPPQLFELIYDIDDAAVKLQGRQDRHPKTTRDIPEAVDQLFCLSDGFRRLAKLQDKPEYDLRIRRVQENVHVLCSSVRYTIDTTLNTLGNPLDEKEWISLTSSMRHIEQTDILERLRWYQAAILGLLDHLDGFTSESLLGVDTNLRSLLERQRSVKRNDSTTLPKASGQQSEASPEASTSNTCYTCHTKLPDSPESKAGICPTCGSWYISNPGAPSENVKTKEAEPANPNTKSENTDLDQPGDQSFSSHRLARLVASTSRVLNILQILQMHHSRDATIIPEITEDLQSLLASFQRLSQLHGDPQYKPNFVKVQEPIQVLCRSALHTLDAMLQVLTAEPQSDETMLMQLTMLTMRMTAEEKVGLPERLRWYSASVLGLLNNLDGFPSAGRIFQWLGMGEKVRSLLERQEGSPE